MRPLRFVLSLRYWWCALVLGIAFGRLQTAIEQSFGLWNVPVGLALGALGMALDLRRLR